MRKLSDDLMPMLQMRRRYILAASHVNMGGGVGGLLAAPAIDEHARGAAEDAPDVEEAGHDGFWHFSLDPCDSYARCGAFRYCDVGQSPQCSCLPGFQPRWTQRWSLIDGSGGCIRRTNLSCGAGDGFWTVSLMKLPEATSATVHAGMTLDQCRQLCLGKCCCRAYAAANVSGGINHGCVVWAVDLIDMQQYPEVVKDVYIRLS
ncbi:putative serine/threonine-protein kinase receptor [Hordeum vulgare]|nr:putative serine/threonine-protein kinase receptor [Hordeum vulgare]